MCAFKKFFLAHCYFLKNFIVIQLQFAHCYFPSYLTGRTTQKFLTQNQRIKSHLPEVADVTSLV